MNGSKKEVRELGTIDTTDTPKWIMSDRIWLICGVLITGLSAFLRFFELALKPLHHDEGVNGYFLRTLFDSGVYKYDPANYHGPTLYYIAVAFAKIFGLETVPIRASVAIFGVLTVVLALYLKDYIGRIGSLFAALLIALSPGMVFISRYFIHETLFVFLSLGLVVSVLLFVEKRPVGVVAVLWMVLVLLICFLPSALNLAKTIGRDNNTAVWVFRAGFFVVEAVLVFLVVRMLVTWNDGRPIYLILASACGALLFATKETAFITIGVMAIACVCVLAWRKLFTNFVWEVGDDELSAEPLTWASFRQGLGTNADRLLIFAAALLTFIYLFVVFFSSFFTYPEGIRGAFEAYTLWTKTGSKDHTQNGMWAYFKWGLMNEKGFEIEAPIFILSAIGAVIALTRAKHRFALFAAFWAFGTLAAYTLIPYKTPWLAMSFLMPMCIIAGYGINELAVSRNSASKLAAFVLGIAAIAVLGYQAYQLNFVRYDDNAMPYVYAHTKREFHDLIGKIKYYADKSGKGRDVTVQIVSPDYWPMVWYMKDYPHANFHGHIVDAANAEMIVAKKDDQDAEVIKKYSADYDYAGVYPLRPGVDLMLLVKKDLADADLMPLYRIEEGGP